MVSEGREEAVTRFFAAYQFEIVTGTHYLGDFLGSKNHKQDWLDDKVEKWNGHIFRMAKETERQPQPKYVVLQQSLKTEWLFI